MARAQTFSLDVSFKLTDIDYKPLPSEAVRLIFGTSPGWQAPTAGHRFITDDKGEARFITDGLIDKRWRSKNVGFTPFGVPIRTEHMTIAAELERRIQERRFRWVITMDLDCNASGECSTQDFTALYTPDAKGHFTQRPPRYGAQDAWKIPELNGAVLFSLGYQPWDFLMQPDPADPQKKRTLKLAFKRYPPPPKQ